MSRCFPFPPPGYEKEARTYDLDLLKKEKERERKLKKEKKNREKKEGKDKEKREKERSEGKHRDKKEKKDKHRDKKDKDRDKDKEKGTRDDTRLPKLVEPASVDKPSDEKTSLPPSRPEANSGDIFRHKGKEPELDRNSLLADKKVSRQFPGHIEKSTQNSQFTDRGIKDRKSVEKFPGAVARHDEGTVRLVANSTATSSDSKEKIRTSGDRKSNDQPVKNGLRFIGNATPQNFPGIVQPKFENSLKPLEHEGDKRVEWKEKSKKKEDDKRKEKQKDRDKEEAKAKQRIQQKKMEPDRLKEIGKDDAVTGIYAAKPPQIVDESIKNPVTGENPKKRKDLETQGFLSANDIKPSKLPKPTQNGRASGVPGWPEAVTKPQTDGKEHVINGVKSSPARTISATPPPPVPTKPLTTPAKPVPPARKPPHPDVEYLNEVLTVPKMAEWSDHDDQNWLFEGGDTQPKKPKVGPSVRDEIPKVWSEALRIESADICALPYVIPY